MGRRSLVAWYYCSMTEAADPKGKKVLIIEDDPLLNTLLMDKLSQLREKGLEVYLATNGEEGVAKARELKPNLIMLDLVLPGMTGFDFLELMLKDEGIAKTPTVILSNLSDDSDKEHAKRLGVVAYFVKADFSLSEITKAIEEVLEHREVTPHTTPVPEVKKTQEGGYVIYL